MRCAQNDILTVLPRLKSQWGQEAASGELGLCPSLSTSVGLLCIVQRAELWTWEQAAARS